MNERRKQKTLEKETTKINAFNRIGGLPKMKFFDKSCLKTDNLFKMTVEEMQREVNKIHNDLFSSSYFRQLGFDATPDLDRDEGSISMINSMSNTSNFEFRNAHYQEETKYIKEPKPWGNPFRMIIRPRNQNIQMSEIEDEAMMTNTEKKKSNRLASYANLYKQHLRNQLKKYGEWFRANQDPTALDLKIKELQEKHEQDKKQMQRREEEVKKKIEKDRRFLAKRDLRDGDFTEDEDAVGTPLVKAEKVCVKDDPNKLRVSALFFDDLYELLCRLREENYHADELKALLKAQTRVFGLKYQDYFDADFLQKRCDEFISHQFGYAF